MGCGIPVGLLPPGGAALRAREEEGENRARTTCLSRCIVVQWIAPVQPSELGGAEYSAHARTVHSK